MAHFHRRHNHTVWNPRHSVEILKLHVFCIGEPLVHRVLISERTYTLKVTILNLLNQWNSGLLKQMFTFNFVGVFTKTKSNGLVLVIRRPLRLGLQEDYIYQVPGGKILRDNVFPSKLSMKTIVVSTVGESSDISV